MLAISVCHKLCKQKTPNAFSLRAVFGACEIERRAYHELHVRSGVGSAICRRLPAVTERRFAVWHIYTYFHRAHAENANTCSRWNAVNITVGHTCEYRICVCFLLYT